MCVVRSGAHPAAATHCPALCCADGAAFLQLHLQCPLVSVCVCASGRRLPLGESAERTPSTHQHSTLLYYC
jgi:hypothetical protein